MIMDNLSSERFSKKKMAIDDFSLLSKVGVVGLYVECELTYAFIIEKEKSICNHYFAICNYEEFYEPDLQLRDKNITDKLIEINENYSLGIIQMRISLDEGKYIFNQLCVNSFCFREKKVKIPQNMQLLPKMHIPAYWDGVNVLLQKVLKPNFFGDSYIIEYLSIDNPFSNIFSANEFDKINSKIKELTNIDLLSVNDRIGSFIFQFPITVVHADCSIISDWCKARLSLNYHGDLLSPSDIYTLVNTKLDDIITGFYTVEGIVDKFIFNIGDSNNFEYTIINKRNNFIYRHFLGNFIRKIFVGSYINIQYAEPRSFSYKDGNTIEVEVFDHSLISTGNNQNIDDRIHNRILYNSIIKQSGDFYSFEVGQKLEALSCVREKINSHSDSSSEIWLWDPYLRCYDIFDTLYYAKKKELR